MLSKLQRLSQEYDPWESLHRRQEFGKNILTSVEFTVTNLCNLRCEHCAVGDALTMKEAETQIPLPLLLQRLEDIGHLDTLSITGGEPMYNKRMVDEYVEPLLRYAHERGARTQINSNLTLDLQRYEKIIPYLDVLHISFNYESVEDFYKVAYVHSSQPVSIKQAEKTFQRMVDNTITLSKRGVFISAESLISKHTHAILPQINHLINEMGCQRHEVHPLYPSDFARSMQVLSLSELRRAYNFLLDKRDPDLWILFGTLPFYACNQDEEDLQLIRRIFASQNVTVRNDPDGHNRLNVNIFTGDVIVTDFADVKPLGNVHTDNLQDCFDRWQNHPIFQQFNCFCPQSFCNGPHLLVANTYYNKQDFTKKKGITLTS
jgi:radical SAM/CxCxxxxC motif protein YfkAB